MFLLFCLFCVFFLFVFFRLLLCLFCFCVCVVFCFFVLCFVFVLLGGQAHIRELHGGNHMERASAQRRRVHLIKSTPLFLLVVSCFCVCFFVCVFCCLFFAGVLGELNLKITSDKK